MRTSGELVFRVCMVLLGQDVLREKQQHIEQLLKERDLERAEITRAASQADEAEQKFYTLKHEFEQYRSECERKIRESDDILTKLKVDRDEILNQLEDEKRKNEDLQFRFEEAAITKSDIEVTSEGYVKRIKELEAKLEEDRQKAEQLEATSNKLFEAEEGLIKAREEIEVLRKDLEQTRTKRETLEVDKTATTQLVESLQKQVDSAKAENEEKLKTISQLSEEVAKIKAENAESKKSSDENCEKKNEQLEKLKHELDHQSKLLEKFGQTHADLAKENEKLKMELSAKSHDLELATDELAAKDQELKSLRVELETVRKDLGQKTDDLERRKVNLHEVEAHLAQARSELKEKITEVENTKKECNLQVSQKDQQISDGNKTIAERSEEIKKLTKELEDVKHTFEDSKNEIHSRHARQVASQDSQLMALSAEIQQKNEEITKSSIVISKLEEDLCAKNGIIEKLRLELESFESQKSSHTEASSLLNVKLNELSLTNGDLQRQLASANERINGLLELKQRLETEIQGLTARCENGAQLEQLRAEIQQRENMLERAKAEFEQKLQNSERLRHEIELQRQQDQNNFAQMKADLETKLRIALQSEESLKQRCDTSVGDLAKMRDEYRMKIDELQHAVQEKDLTVANLQNKCSEAVKQYEDQLRVVNDELNRRLQECQQKISSFNDETANLKEELAKKSEQLIEARAESSHVLAQRQQLENELKQKYNQDTKQLEFELNGKNMELEKALTEVQLLRNDCQNTNSNLTAKDVQISELAAQVKNAQNVINQLQEELTATRLKQQLSSNEHENVQNQYKGLLDQVAALTEQVKTGEAVFKNLQIEHKNAMQLVNRLRITEQQKQQCLQQLQLEASSGDNKNCDQVMQLLNQVKVDNTTGNTEKILNLQKDLDLLRNQLAERNHQFDGQQNELLRLQQELVKAQQVVPCAGGSQEPNSVSLNDTQHNTKQHNTLHAPQPSNLVELQVQLSMLKNSYGQLASRFDALRKENSYLLARLQNAVNNGNPNVVNNVLRKLAQANQQYNAFRNAMQGDNFNLQKTLQNSMLQLQDRDRALNHQNIQIKNLQQVISSLPTQCRNFAVPGENLETNDCSNLSVDNKKLADLIKTKDGEVQNLRKQLSSLLIEYSNLKSQNQVCIQKPCLCASAQVKTVPVLTPSPPKIVRVMVPVVQPKIVVKEVKVPQVGGQRCPPPRIERIEVPKVIIQKVPLQVPVPSKCTLPDLSNLYHCDSLQASIDQLSLPNYGPTEIFKFKQTLLSLITRQKNCMASSIKPQTCTNLPKINVPHACVAPSSIVDSLVLNGYSNSVVTSYKENLLLLLQNVQNCALNNQQNCPKLPSLKVPDSCLEPLDVVNSVDLRGYSPSDTDYYKQSLLQLLNKLQKCSSNQHSLSGFSSTTPGFSNNLQNNCSLLRLPLLEPPLTCLSPSQYAQTLVIKGFNPVDVALFKESLKSLIEKLQTCKDDNYKPVSSGPQQATCGNLPKLPTVGNCLAPPQIINQVNLDSFSKLEADIFKQTLLELLHLQQKCCAKQTPQVQKPVYVRVPVPQPPKIVVKQVPRIIVKQVPVPVPQPPKIITKQVYVPAGTKCKPIIQQVPVKFAVPVKIKVPVRIPVTKPCHLPNIDIFDCSSPNRVLGTLDLTGYNPTDASRFKESLLSLIQRQRVCVSPPTSGPMINPQVPSNNSPNGFLGASQCDLPDLSQLQGCLTPQMIESLNISPKCSKLEVLTFKQTLLGVVATQRNCALRSANPLTSSEHITPNGGSPTGSAPKVIVKEIRVPVRVMQPPRILIKQVPVPVPQPPKIIIKQVPILANKTSPKPIIIYKEKPVMVQLPPRVLVKQVPVKVLVPVQSKGTDCHLPSISINSCADLQNDINSLALGGFNIEEVNSFKQNLYSVLMQQRSCSQCHLPDVNIQGCEALEQQIGSLKIPGYNQWDVEIYKQKLLSMLNQQRQCSTSNNGGGPEVPQPPRVIVKHVPVPQPPKVIFKHIPVFTNCDKKLVPGSQPFGGVAKQEPVRGTDDGQQGGTTNAMQCHLPNINIQGCADLQKQIDSADISRFDSFEVMNFKRNLLEMLLGQRKCTQTSGSTGQQPIYIRVPVKVPVRVEVPKEVRVPVPVPQPPRIIIKQVPVQVPQPPRVIIKQVPVMTKCDHKPNVVVQEKPVQIPSPPRIVVKQVPVRVPASSNLRCHLPRLQVNNCDDVQNVVGSLSLPDYDGIEVDRFKQDVFSLLNLQRNCIKCKLPDLQVIAGCHALQNQVQNLPLPNYNSWEVQTFKQNLLSLLEDQRKCVPQSGNLVRDNTLPPGGGHGGTVNPGGLPRCVPQIVEVPKEVRFPMKPKEIKVYVPQPPKVLIKQVEVPVPQPPKVIVKEVPVRNENCNQEPRVVVKEKPVHIPVPGRTITKEIPVRVNVPVRVPVKSECHLPIINVNSCDNIRVQSEIDSLAMNDYSSAEALNFKQNLLSSFMQQRNCVQCRLPQVNLAGCEDLQKQVDSIVLPNYNSLDVENFKRNLFTMLLNQRQCMQKQLPGPNSPNQGLNPLPNTATDEPRIRQQCVPKEIIKEVKVPVPQPPKIITKEVPVPQPPRVIIKEVPVFKCDRNQVGNGGIPDRTPSAPSEVQSGIPGQCAPKVITKEVKVPVKVFVPQPPRMIIKEVPVFKCNSNQISNGEKGVPDRRLGVPSDAQSGTPQCEPKIIIKEVPQPPRVMIKEVPVLKCGRNHFGNGEGVPDRRPSAPSDAQSGIPQCAPKTIIKEVKVPVPQPPRVIVKEVPVFKCNPNQIRNGEGVPDGRPSAPSDALSGTPQCEPKIIIKEVPVPQPPRVIIKEAPVLKCDRNDIRNGEGVPNRIPNAPNDIPQCEPKVIIKEVPVPQPPRVIIKEVPVLKCDRNHFGNGEGVPDGRPSAPSDAQSGITQCAPKIIIKEVKVPVPQPPRVIIKEVPIFKCDRNYIGNGEVVPDGKLNAPNDVHSGSSGQCTPKVIIKEVKVSSPQPPRVIIKQVPIFKCDRNQIMNGEQAFDQNTGRGDVNEDASFLPSRSPHSNYNSVFSGKNVCDDLQNEINSLVLPLPNSPQVPDFKQKLLLFILQQRKCVQCRLPSLDIGGCQDLQNQVASLNMPNYISSEVQTFKTNLLNLLLQQRNCVKQPNCEAKVIKVPVDRPIYHRVPVKIPVKEIVEVPKRVVVPVPFIKQVPVRVPVKQIVEVPREVVKEVRVPVEVPKEVIKQVPVKTQQPPKVVIKQVPVAVRQPPKVIIKQVPVPTNCDKPNIIVREKPVPVPVPSPPIVKQVPVKVLVKAECHLPQIDFNNLNTCGDIHSVIGSLTMPGFNLQEVDSFKEKLLAAFAQQRNCAHCRLPDIDINKCDGLEQQVDSLNIQNSNLWEVQTFKHKLLTVLLSQRNCVAQQCRPQVVKVPVDRPVYKEVPVKVPIKQIVEVPKEVIREVKIPVYKQVPVRVPVKQIVKVPVPQPPRILVREVTVPVPQPPKIIVKQIPIVISKCTQKPRIVVKEKPVPIQLPPRTIIKEVPVRVKVPVPVTGTNDCHLPTINLNGCEDVENQIASLAISGYSVQEVQHFKQNLLSLLYGQRNCVQCHLPDFGVSGCTGLESQIAAINLPNFNPLETQKFKQNLFAMLVNQRQCGPLHGSVPQLPPPDAGSLINKDQKLNGLSRDYNNNNNPKVGKEACQPRVLIKEVPVPVPQRPKVIVKQVPVMTKCDQKPQIIVREKPVPIPSEPRIVIKEVPVSSSKCHLPYLNVGTCDNIQSQIENLKITGYSSEEVTQFKQNLLSILTNQRNCGSNHCPTKECHLPNINIKGCSHLENQISTLTVLGVNPGEVQTFKQNLLSLLLQQQNCQKAGSGNQGIPSQDAQGSQPPGTTPQGGVPIAPQGGVPDTPQGGIPITLQGGVPTNGGGKPQLYGKVPINPVEGAPRFSTLSPFSSDRCVLPELNLLDCDNLKHQIAQLRLPGCSDSDFVKFRRSLYELQRKYCIEMRVNPVPLPGDLSGVSKSPSHITNRQSSCSLPRIDLHGCTNLQNQIESLNLNHYDRGSVNEFKQNLLSLLVEQRRCSGTEPENCRPQIIKVPVPQPPRIILKQVPVYIKGKPEGMNHKQGDIVEPVQVPGKATPVYAQKPVSGTQIPVNLCPKPQIVVKQVPVVRKVFVPQPCNSESGDKFSGPHSGKPTLNQTPVPKVVVKQVPVYVKVPKIVEKQVPVRVLVPPKVIIKEVKVPMVNGKSCPPPKVVIEKVPVPQPPQIITKPVLVSVPCNKTGQIILPTLPLPRTCERPENVVNGVVFGGYSNNLELFKRNLLQLLKHQQNCDFGPKSAQLDRAKFPSKAPLCQARLLKRVHTYASQLCRYKKLIKQLQLQLNGLSNLRQEQLPAVPLPMLHVMKSVSPSVPLRPFQHVSSVSASRATFVRNLNQVYKHTQAALQHCMDAILAQSLTHSQINAKCNNCQQLIQDKEMAENQIKFLNSIIVDMQKKTEEQKARIEILESGYSPAMADELKLMGSPQRQVPPRVYCDICEEFDLHETEDCPKQNTDLAPANGGQREHKHVPERPYCEICEAFGHATEDCQEDQTF